MRPASSGHQNSVFHKAKNRMAFVNIDKGHKPRQGALQNQIKPSKYISKMEKKSTEETSEEDMWMETEETSEKNYSA